MTVHGGVSPPNNPRYPFHKWYTEMWKNRADQIELIREQLAHHSANIRELPGIKIKLALDTLSLQVVASVRRFDYTNLNITRPIDPERANPLSDFFDPERAAVLLARSGDIDEAIWLTFLATHFGQHAQYGWRLLRDVYSGLGTEIWSWPRVVRSLDDFAHWIGANQGQLRGGFGNHRKFESLRENTPNGTPNVVRSYVAWIGPEHSHVAKFGKIINETGNDPGSIFDALYREMKVKRFSRLGKFDFLAQLGRLDLIPAIPSKAYLQGSTGPLKGARLLFGGSTDAALGAKLLENRVSELDKTLTVGMAVLEDSLCNWQKSPLKFVHFKG